MGTGLLQMSPEAVAGAGAKAGAGAGAMLGPLAEAKGQEQVHCNQRYNMLSVAAESFRTAKDQNSMHPKVEAKFKARCMSGLCSDLYSKVCSTDAIILILLHLVTV